MKDVRLQLFQTGFKTLEMFRPLKAQKKAVVLFSTPRRYPRPKREARFMDESTHYDVSIPFEKENLYNVNWAVGKVDMDRFNDDGDKTRYRYYEMGEGPVVLLVHGWGGRASQMGKIAQSLADNGYKAISFDGFAHGESPGTQTTALEFAAIIRHIQQRVGSFQAIIGHSLGGMAAGIAISAGVKADRLITIGSPTSITRIIEDFCTIINGGQKIADYLNYFLQGYAACPLDTFSLAQIGKNLQLPGLIIHDKQDKEVAYDQAIALDKSWENGRLLLTERLGHARILRDETLIEQIMNFIKNKVDIVHSN